MRTGFYNLLAGNRKSSAYQAFDRSAKDDADTDTTTITTFFLAAGRYFQWQA